MRNGLMLLALLLTAARPADAAVLAPGDVVGVTQGGGIHRIDPDSGEVTVVLDNGDLGYLPRGGLALDGQGWLVLPATPASDPEGVVAVIRVEPETGAVEVVSQGGLLGPPAVDVAVGADRRLFVAAGVNGLLEIDPVSGAQSVVPQVSAPFAVGLDRAGGLLWVSRPGRGAPLGSGAGMGDATVVFRVDPSGAQPLAIEFVPSCNQHARLLSADDTGVFLACGRGPAGAPGSASIHRVEVDPSLVSLVASGGLLDDPYAVAREVSGDLVVSDRGRILRIDPDTGAQSLLATVEATGIAVVRAACDDGIDNDADGAIDAADAQCEGPGDLSERRNPCGDGIDNDGDGAVDAGADPGCRDVDWTSESPSCDNGLDDDLDGFADDSDPDCSEPWVRLERPVAAGDLFVVNTPLVAGDPRVVRVDPTTGLQEVFSEVGLLTAPWDVDRGREGALLVTDPGVRGVVRIDREGAQSLLVATPPESNGMDDLIAPSGLAVESDGGILVGDLARSHLLRADGETGDLATLSELAAPSAGLALEPGGGIVVAQPDLDALVLVDPDTGAWTPIATAPLSAPGGVAAAPDGDILVRDAASIRRIDAATGGETPVASLPSPGGPWGGALGIEVTRADDVIAASTTTGELLRIPPQGAPTVLTAGGALPAPLGIVEVRPACDDQLDNDGDGLADFPDDPGCDDGTDDSERAPGIVCDDGLDDDGDGLADFPDDPGCDGPLDTSEQNPLLVCDDGLDNDLDGTIDTAGDAGCDDAFDPSERSPALVCDDGLDDDGDGLADFPDDPGCSGPLAIAEDPECDDGVDNDEDGLADGADPGCDTPSDGSERSASLPCDDELDNDDDGRFDYPFDVGCEGPLSPVEDPECDDGVDNDGDGGFDWTGPAPGTPADAECTLTWHDDESTAPVPEPGRLHMLAAGVLALVGLVRRRARRRPRRRPGPARRAAPVVCALGLLALAGGARAACNCQDTDGDGYPDNGDTCQGSSVKIASTWEPAHEVTFHFGESSYSDVYTCGMFANGDFWVATRGDPSVVVIDRITPDWNGTGNGYQLDPHRLRTNGEDQTHQSLDARNSYFRAPPPLPLVVTPDASGASSLVKVIERRAGKYAPGDYFGPAQNCDVNQSPAAPHCFYFAAVLTVVSEPVTDSHTAFRPPYMGAWNFVQGTTSEPAATHVKPIYRTTQIDFAGRFPKRACATCVDRPDLVLLRDLYKMLHFDVQEHNTHKRTRPFDVFEVLGNGAYGYDFGNRTTIDLIRMALDDFDPVSDPLARQVAINYVQTGIDYIHGAKDGDLTFPNGGGHPWGPRPLAFAAAYFLDEPDLVAWLDSPQSDEHFAETTYFHRTDTGVSYSSDPRWETAWSAHFEDLSAGGTGGQDNPVVLWGQWCGDKRRGDTTPDGGGTGGMTHCNRICDTDTQLGQCHGQGKDPFHWIDGGGHIREESDYERGSNCLAEWIGVGVRLFPGGNDVWSFPESYEYGMRRRFFGYWTLPDQAGPRYPGKHATSANTSGSNKCYPGDGNATVRFGESFSEAFWQDGITPPLP